MVEIAIPRYVVHLEEHVLKRKAKRFLTFALAIAAGIHLGLIGLYWAGVAFSKEEPPTRVVRILKYSELGPPPSISATSAVAPSVSVAQQSVKPTVGIPVPVPDAEVNPEQTFATQQELSDIASPIGEGTGIKVRDEEIQITDDNAPPPDFVPFEKEPVLIRKVDPVYPKLAREAELEGTVAVNIWVDKQGKVRDVKVLKSTSEIFVQPVIDAVKQWQFSPAMMKNGPVAVWVAVPFRFSLEDIR
jgi:TonB family protein